MGNLFFDEPRGGWPNVKFAKNELVWWFNEKVTVVSVEEEYGSVFYRVKDSTGHEFDMLEAYLKHG